MDKGFAETSLTRLGTVTLRLDAEVGL